MTTDTLHPLARDYLKRLKELSRRLPRARRTELLEEIEAHLREAIPADAGEAEAREVLERLGDPEQIVAEAMPDGPPARAGMREWLAIPLLLVGGFVFLVGWIVGVALLWSSRIWTLRDKLIGTLLLPGGLATAVFVLAFPAGTQEGEVMTKVCDSSGKCHGVSSGASGGISSWELVAVIALLALPVVTSIYLTWRANHLTAA
jgi:hypothetical protein